MRVGLIDVDGKNPNLALMKISAWHKAQGDHVEWFKGNQTSIERIYASKVFNFSKDFAWHIFEGFDTEIIKGGTGYDIKSKLDPEIEAMQPDYSIYPKCDYSLGFLTRGCPNRCPWCVVPEKEGDIHAVADIEQIAQHKRIVLMDNNVLACDHGIRQIEKISKMDIKIDFNQGIDARLIDDSIAKLLAKCKWLKPVRLACDTKAQMPEIANAVCLLKKHNCTPQKYFVYVLVKDIQDALERVEFLRSLNVNPFAQPYRDIHNVEYPTKEQLRFARWVNRKQIFNSTKWSNYHA